MSYVMHKRLTCDFSTFKRCGFVRHVKGAYLLSSENRLSRRSEPVRSNGLYETVLLVDNLFLSLKLEYNNNIDFKVFCCLLILSKSLNLAGDLIDPHCK